MLRTPHDRASSLRGTPGRIRQSLSLPSLVMRLGVRHFLSNISFPLTPSHTGLNAFSGPINRFWDSAAPGRWQTEQFRFHRTLAKLGTPLVNDPLFECSVMPEHGHKEDAVKVHLVYRGLRVKGFSNRNLIAELLIDGKLLRRDKVTVDNGGRFFWLFINRPALAQFPTDCELQVRLEDTETATLIEKSRFSLRIPHGTGEIFQTLREQGPIDKKGNLPVSPVELLQRQQAMLSLYETIGKTFQDLFGKPLFLMYGTLLGLHRDRDFIPGDDDFDVGFVSEHCDPAAVKQEAKEMILRLAREGFTITLNRKGKPFRIHDGSDNPDLHLDACPVWYQEDRVWANPYGCFPLSLDAFRTVETCTLRGTEVQIPTGTEAFLQAYYGKNWRTPDPDYTLSRPLTESMKRNFLAICLKPSEVNHTRMLLECERRKGKPVGRIHSKAIQSLYPLGEYEALCAWD